MSVMGMGTARLPSLFSEKMTPTPAPMERLEFVAPRRTSGKSMVKMSPVRTVTRRTWPRPRSARRASYRGAGASSSSRREEEARWASSRSWEAVAAAEVVEAAAALAAGWAWTHPSSVRCMPFGARLRRALLRPERDPGGQRHGNERARSHLLPRRRVPSERPSIKPTQASQVVLPFSVSSFRPRSPSRSGLPRPSPRHPPRRGPCPSSRSPCRRIRWGSRKESRSSSTSRCHSRRGRLRGTSRRSCLGSTFHPRRNTRRSDSPCSSCT